MATASALLPLTAPLPHPPPPPPSYSLPCFPITSSLFPPPLFFPTLLLIPFRQTPHPPHHTANEGLLRIQLVPIYVIPEMKLCGPPLFPKQNYNVLSPNFHIHVSVRN
jgi:hypothetical protein